MSNENILNKYPVLNKYNPVIKHPSPSMEELTIEVDDLTKLYDDIGVEIIIGKDSNDNMYYLEIYDDCRE